MMKDKSAQPIVIIYGTIALLYGLLQGFIGLRLASLPKIIEKLPPPHNMLSQFPQFSQIMKPVSVIAIVMTVLAVLFIASGILHYSKRQIGRIGLFGTSILQFIFIIVLTVIFIQRVIPVAEEVLMIAKMFGSSEIGTPWFLNSFNVIIFAEALALIPQIFIASFFIRPIKKHFTQQ